MVPWKDHQKRPIAFRCVANSARHTLTRLICNCAAAHVPTALRFQGFEESLLDHLASASTGVRNGLEADMLLISPHGRVTTTTPWKTIPERWEHQKSMHIIRIVNTVWNSLASIWVQDDRKSSPGLFIQCQEM